MKETEQTLLDQIKNQVAREIVKKEFTNIHDVLVEEFYRDWSDLLASENVEEYLDEVCERYYQAKACASDVCTEDGNCDHCREPKKLARLLPKEEFKPAQPTPNFPKGGTTFTESAYKEIEGKGKLIGHIIDDFKNGKEIFVPAVESSEPQEKMSYWQYQQFAEAVITQLKDRNETLESEIKALREEISDKSKTCADLTILLSKEMEKVNKLEEELERLKAELKNANSALDNISDMGHA